MNCVTLTRQIFQSAFLEFCNPIVIIKKCYAIHTMFGSSVWRLCIARSHPTTIEVLPAY